MSFNKTGNEFKGSGMSLTEWGMGLNKMGGGVGGVEASVTKS
jgi:hypothetical protein